MSSIFTYNPTDEFERLYIYLREKEGRMYKDEEVANLPAVNELHSYYHEWEIRKRSAKKLVDHIRHRNNEPDILEIGCGNGWLSAQLATSTKGNVTGIDVNGVELEQAKRVFSKISNLNFIQCALNGEQLQDKSFDIIVFAASIQYFSSLKKIITEALAYLTLQGEIHIIDSHFYRQSEIAAAKERTISYFVSAGCEVMTEFYFHHTIEDLDKFNHHFLYDPTSLFNRFNKNKSPFYHVVIKNRYQ
ncbi:class I SAM-dependent methyltransferase [Ferruginibacter sp. SUN106]|uniref:class I SAM-dependent methyltransferase n=1 Tax=Ferruginibacter sp. SUN106 TaxID=2978348 RepID=UPI003D36BB88